MTTREQFNTKNNLNPGRGFSRNQKTAAIFLAVFALGVVVLGIIQISSQVRKPFQVPNKNGQETLTELDLSSLDSDNDGLSDYDELYTYKTSPYLEDSDSDNINDYDEIQNNSDPLCPTGKNCYATEFLEAETNEQNSLDYLITPEVNSESEGEIDLNAVTPEVLRAILLESGYGAEELSQISDDDLMASYQEALRLKNENEGQE